MVVAGGGQVIILSDLLTGESSTIHTYVYMDGPDELTGWENKKQNPKQNSVRIVGEGLLRETLEEDKLG